MCEPRIVSFASCTPSVKHHYKNYMVQAQHICLNQCQICRCRHTHAPNSAVSSPASLQLQASPKQHEGKDQPPTPTHAPRDAETPKFSENGNRPWNPCNMHVSQPVRPTGHTRPSVPGRAVTKSSKTGPYMLKMPQRSAASAHPRCQMHGQFCLKVLHRYGAARQQPWPRQQRWPHTSMALHTTSCRTMLRYSCNADAKRCCS
jgi:hypothetical protein